MSEFYYQKKHSGLFLNVLINIREIEFERLTSEIRLRESIRKKYVEYITFRQTTAYNPDKDCPVCYESKCDFTSGQNCEHLVCVDCFEKISSTTNKCPICRENLENQTETEEEEEEEEDTEEELLFYGGSNLRHTINLYRGRRWFNTETNNIEYYIGNGEWGNDNYLSFHTFVENYNGNNEMGFCSCCGIQQTIEVNNYMRDFYGGNFYFNSNIDNPMNSFTIDWDNFFDVEFNYCFDCRKKHLLLEYEFNRML